MFESITLILFCAWFFYSPLDVIRWQRLNILMSYQRRLLIAAVVGDEGKGVGRVVRQSRSHVRVD